MSEGKDKDQHGTHLQAVSARGQELTVYDPSVQQVEEDETIDLREYWRILVKRKWTVIGVAVIVLTAALLSSLLMVPEYRSTAQVEINPESARILNYQDFAPEAQGWNATGIFYSTQFQILRSSALAEQVIRDEQLQDHPELQGQIRQRSLMGEIRSLFYTVTRAIMPSGGGSPGATGERRVPSAEEVEAAKVRRAANVLRSRISVNQVEGSRLVNVSVRAFDPQLAKQLANSLVQNYIEMSMQRRYEAGNEARGFLEDQLEDMRIQLERADEALMEFARENNVADLDQRLSMARTAIQQFNDRRTSVEAELVQLESYKTLIEQGRTEHLDPIVNSDSINALEQRLIDARSEYASLSERFQDSYPAVQEVLTRIDRLEQEITDERQNIVGNILGRYENLQAQSEALESAMQERESSMLALNEQAVQYNILRREFETNRELYDGLLQRMKEIGVAAGIQENNIAIIEEAVAAGAPFKPNIPRNLMLALAIGLMGGIALALVLEFLDSSIRRVEDIERLVDRPVLGMVPLVKLRDKKNETDKQIRDSERIVSHYSAVHPHSAVSEAFRSLRTSLMFSTPEGLPRTLMVTSSGMGEGKTRVLLIDADLRKPRIHRDFNLFRSPGLTNRIALSENNGPDNSAIHATHVPHMFIMPSGNSTPSPAEMLSSERLAKVLDSCRRAFDYIIMDAPPTLGLADSMILARQVDGVVMVARAGSTGKENFRVAIKRLSQVKAPVLGVVLNGVDLDSPEYAYYSSYYYNYEAEDDESVEAKPKLGSSSAS
ncbi:MAG: polysaccharide biosynthesis tyrosine autokinase [Gammaproteobacteria bacterium]|jgi:capsular exopolysaccharide synthesis family protein|nr:polysaccharide biosynthesis tyrosine autokinase [Gammaproteobacteria bacterium]